MPYIEVRRLLEGRCFSEGGAYFSMDTKGVVLIGGRRLFESRLL